MLRCSDGSYYTGVTSNLEERVTLHNIGADITSYTYTRRPVELVFCEECDYAPDAIQREKQIQGWSRKKKEALIEENWEQLHVLAMNRRNREKHAEKLQDASARASASKDSSVACNQEST